MCAFFLHVFKTRQRSRQALNAVKVRLSTNFPVGGDPEFVRMGGEWGRVKMSSLDWNRIFVALSQWTLLTAAPGAPLQATASLPPSSKWFIHQPQRRSPASRRHLRHERPPLFSLTPTFLSPARLLYSKFCGRGLRLLSAPRYDATRRRGLSAFLSARWAASHRTEVLEKVNIREKS